MSEVTPRRIGLPTTSWMFPGGRHGMQRTMESAVTDQTMIVTLTVHELRHVIREVVTEALKTKAQHDLLNLKEVHERYGVGRGALLAAARRGEVELFRGPRRKLLVRAADLERWLTTRKYSVPSRGPDPDTMDEWDREAEREFERFAQESATTDTSTSSAASRAIAKALAEGRLRTLSPEEIERSRRSKRSRGR